MKRFKGPELKLSELKVPPLLRDLYMDLRDRRLLPVIGLLLAAVVATPFLLGGSDKEVVPPSASPALGANTADASLAVLPAQPGLREPGKRLAHRSAKNPFKQKYTGPVFHKGSAPVEESTVSEGGSGGTVTESGGGGSSAPAPESPPVESGGGGGSGGGGAPHVPAPGTGELRLFAFSADIKLSHTETTESDQKKMSEPETREEVLPTTPLPGKKTPALTYLGADPKTAKKALFLISPEVSSLSGDGKCVSGTASCQLLELAPETPEVVEYGLEGARYKIEVLKIKPVITGTYQTKGK
jgi:hypothetical protein